MMLKITKILMSLLCFEPRIQNALRTI